MLIPLALLSHILVQFGWILDSYVKAFPGVPGPLPVAEARRWQQLKQQSGCVLGCWHSAYPTKAARRLEATQPREIKEIDDYDNDRDVESRAVLDTFKRSVLDENGRVRRMTHDQAREVARVAADGILLQAEREVRSKLPPPANLGGMACEDDDASADDIDPRRSFAARGVMTSGLGVPKKLEEEQREKEGEEEDEEEEGLLLDWGDGSEKKRREARGGKGTPIGRPVLQASPEVEAEYQSTLIELKAYHVQHGNLLLTHDYAVVGEDGGAVRRRGWRLGQKVYHMKFWKRHVRDRPARRTELAKMGFIWGRLQDEYNLFLEALLAYKDIEGSLLVPSSFIVPEEAPWPLCCQGMRLGAKVAGVRNQSLYVRTDVSRWYQLDAMGFVWDLSDAPFRQVYEALLQYKAQHGNLHVPVAFRVPDCPPWHEDLRGLALGQRVLDIRARHRYIRNDPDRIRMLNEARFLWTDAVKSSYASVIRALKAYRKVKGRDFSVPSSFVVPSFLPWPQSCWGLRLGTALVDIRSKGRYLKGEDSEQRKRELENLGVFAQSREAIMANVVKGLRCYLDVVGDTMVPQGFVVPDEESWPRECWGQKLGSMLYGLRRRPERLDRHPSVRAELSALGFSWEVPKKGPRGPRKRKTAADPLTRGSGVSDESAENSIAVEIFEMAAPSKTVGSHARAPLSVRLTPPRPAPPASRSQPEITVMTAASAEEGHQPSVARPVEQPNAIIRKGANNNFDTSVEKDSAATGPEDSKSRSEKSARSSDAEPRRIRTGKVQGGERRSKGLLAPAARWLLEEGGSFLGASEERRTLSKRRPAGGTGSLR